MPHKDKNYDGSLILDFRKRWRHVKTIYTVNWILSEKRELPLDRYVLFGE